MLGERPSWTQKILLSTTAPKVRQSKTSSNDTNSHFRTRPLEYNILAIIKLENLIFDAFLLNLPIIKAYQTDQLLGLINSSYIQNN